MAGHGLEGCALKLHRADCLMKALNAEIERFRKPERHPLITNFDSETGEYVYLVDEDNPPPEWAALIGDILHNLHSALDHLAWALGVRRNYGHALPPETRLAFPIFKNRSRFWKRGSEGRWSQRSGVTALLQMPGDARKLILAVQPYKDGDLSPSHPLWLLHALSNQDKHQTLHMVGSALLDTSYEILEQANVRIDSFQTFHRPLRGRTVVARLKITATGSHPKCKIKPQFSFAETFGERSPASGEYIGHVLNRIAEYVFNDVFVSRFSPYFGV